MVEDRNLLQVVALGGRRLGLDSGRPAAPQVLPSARRSRKLALPIVQWMMPALSVRNAPGQPWRCAPLPATFGDTVPTFGFGIRPRGPSTWPSLPTTRIASGVAMTTSKFRSPALHLLGQVVHADGVGAGGQAPSALAPAGQNTATRAPTCRYRPQHGGTAHPLVRLLGIDAQAHGHVDRPTNLALLAVLQDLQRVFEGYALARLGRRP